ncbi:DUF3027 domain-containing protein [Marinitenerispora sediminis]|uniref:DUF3027 domain-containing protein n=1 Tax=Marinitenerispora sediminis TaxID=1931232 RepID=A0A368T6A3_9ACTN|nr:DUF3027 domain-containing protein [Marinitenerispora sediminis]RCV54878.1 DUF3027 domain-containing protein [Marinitenerispora sediminis]RCV59259.1 DUF3027 domain-containing protein [Marinitenerispora sediminis]RCV60279.1 DUF3027 domain-containing protein [Marinitenerispora sediminis]
MEAVDLARASAAEIGRPEWVGEHLSAQVEGDRLVTHLFACLDPAYPGWQYAVTVVRASRAKYVTVNEAVMLPGPDALLAPEWLPWKERLRPGDLGVGDILPSAEDDERLMPGYAQVADGEVADEGTDRQMVWELGLGRARVLSEVGREAAAERWYHGPAGPASPIAAAAPAKCATCGFMTPLAGEFRQLFGVCANEYAPDDGKVVSMDHGCGAHSEVAPPAPHSEPLTPVVDEMGYDHIVFDDTTELELVTSDT